MVAKKLSSPGRRSISNVKNIISASGAEIAEAYENIEGIERYTTIEKQAVNNIVATDVVYGIRWDSVNDIIVKGIILNGTFVESTYTDYPIQEEMIRGLRTTTGMFSPLNTADSTKLPDGSAATVDGSAGQTMVRVSKFYLLVTIIGNYKYLLISKSVFVYNGKVAWVPPIFGSDEYRYIGAYNCVSVTDSVSSDAISAILDTSGYSTNSYANPFSNRTRAQFRNQMQEGFFQYCWGLYEITSIMYLTEFAEWNTQVTLPGYTGASAYNYNYTRPAGRTTVLGNSSGSILVDLTGVDSDLDGIVDETEYVANSYRGIENFYGNVYDFIDGINIDNTTGDCHIYVCHTPDNFADDTTIGYIDTGYSPGFGDLDGYIKDMIWQDEDVIFYPSVITGASSSTYITDYHYNATGAWRVLRVGGSLSSGARAGLWFLSAAGASSDVSSILSARSAA